MNYLLDKLAQRNRFEVYSSVFRIFICIHLVKDIISTWQYNALLYESKLFLPSTPSFILEMCSIKTEWIRNNFQWFITFYLILIVFYFFGIGKNITALFLFIFFEISQRLCYIILNGGDNLLKFIMLYMIFMDSYKYFSIKSKGQGANGTYITNVSSNIAGLSICIHLCLAYFLSGIHKIHADVWFNGIATYYTLSSERFRGTRWNLILAKNGLFVTLTTYATILIEICYSMLVWFRKTRPFVITAAVLLHLGIYVFMMIYDFQLVFIVVQGFFISNDQWLRFGRWIKSIFIKLTSPETMQQA